MDFGELNFNGIIGTDASSGAIWDADLWRIRLLAPHKILN